jgi:hypothetical protein
MKSTAILLATAVLGVGVVTWGSTAHAQERYLSQPMWPPSNAFEFQLSTGYTQGFGNVFSNVPINSVAGAGMGFTADLGYRINPLISIEAEGQYNLFTAQNGTSSQGLDVNFGATVHASPASRGDPWLRLATGWRAIWQGGPTGPVGFGTVNNTNDFSGWDLINARIGLDIRTSGNVAWAPFFGADLQAFSWQNGSVLPTTQWGTFLYTGLQGRFDIGGTSAPKCATPAAQAYVGDGSAPRCAASAQR